MEKKRLNLGCGMDIRKGWVNLDRVALQGVDVVHDLAKLPLPFQDESFDEILAQDLLEHFEPVALMRELYRIMRPKGTLTIRVPHFTSKNAYTDPTHRSFFAVRTFSFFAGSGIKGRGYYFDFHFGVLESVRLTFEASSRFFFYNKFVSWAVNRSMRTQYLFESTFLSRLFPAENIIAVLRK